MAAAVFAVLTFRSHTPSVESLAVLPFENPSGDSTLAYYADGLTDDLITRLYSISALSVRSTRRIMQYRDSEKSPYEIAKELGVQALLTGRVRWETIAWCVYGN